MPVVSVSRIARVELCLALLPLKPAHFAPGRTEVQWSRRQTSCREAATGRWPLRTVHKPAPNRVSPPGSRLATAGIRAGLSLLFSQRSLACKETGQQLAALLPEHSADHLAAMVQPPVVEQLIQAHDRSCLRIAGAKDHPRNPSQ